MVLTAEHEIHGEESDPDPSCASPLQFTLSWQNIHFCSVLVC